MRIIIGLAGSGKTTTCLEEIATEIMTNQFWGPLYLIVPEQATFEAQKKLAEICGKGFMRAEVLGFQYFAYHIYSKIENKKFYLSEAGRKLILRYLAYKNKKKFKTYGKNFSQRNFISELAEQIKDLKIHGILPYDLYNKYFGSASAKVSDISLLYKKCEEYKKKNNFVDSDDYMVNLPLLIPKYKKLKEAKFWLDGFNFFNKPQLNIIKALHNLNVDITITLTMDDINNDFSKHNNLFFQQYKTFQFFKKTYPKTKIIVKKEQKRFINKSIKLIGKSIIDDKRIENESWRGINFAKALDKNEEADWIGRKIIELVRDKHFRWRDIAVVGRNIEHYKNTLKNTFKTHNISYSFDEPYPVAHNCLSDFIRAIIEIKLKNWDYQAVFSSIKTGMFNEFFDNYEYDKLENYVLKYGIKGKNWQKEFIYGFQGEEKEKEKSKLNCVREYLKKTINIFCKNSLKETIKKYVQSLEELLKVIKAELYLENLAIKAEKENDKAASAGYRRVWQVINEIFKELKLISNNEKISLNEFASIISEGLDAVQIKITPPGLDYLGVYSIDSMRMPEKQAIFILGMNEGILPQYDINESSLLNQNDYEQLNKVGIETPISGIDKIFADYFIFYSALSQAREYLFFSYSSINTRGKIQYPSFFLEKIIKMMGKEYDVASSYNQICSQHNIKTTALDYFSSFKRAKNEFAKLVREGIKRESELPYWRVLHEKIVQDKNSNIYKALAYNNDSDNLSPNIAQKLIMNDNAFVGNVTKFETYFSCPFKFFVNYMLKLKKREKFNLEILDVGNIYHETLYCIGKIFTENGFLMNFKNIEQSNFTVILKKIREIFETQADKIKNNLFSSNSFATILKKRLYKRFKKTFIQIVSFSKYSKFDTIYLEKTFGNKDCTWEGLELKEKKVLINGKIDRIDLLKFNGKKYGLIIDYKTNKSELNFCELYFGLKLQLPVYLETFLQNYAYKTEPAGVLYIGLENDRISTGYEDDIKKKKFKKTAFSGLLSSDIYSGNEYMFDYVNMKFKKDKSSDYLINKKFFNLLIKNAKNKILTASENILNGFMHIKPVKCKNLACEYCSFIDICRFDQSLGDKYEIKAIADTEVFKKLETELGYNNE